MKSVIAILSIAGAAVAGCATDPYTTRDVTTAIEQAGKVGKGPATPPATKESADEPKKPAQ